MSNYDFNVFIIGGGINGCGIARDAVGRGYRGPKTGDGRDPQGREAARTMAG